jgi:hypothetical protein
LDSSSCWSLSPFMSFPSWACCVNISLSVAIFLSFSPPFVPGSPGLPPYSKLSRQGTLWQWWLMPAERLPMIFLCRVYLAGLSFI